MTQILEDLAADRLGGAIELIRDLDTWCQHSTGKVGGVSIDPLSEYCEQRCAVGSLLAVGPGDEDPVHVLAVQTLNTAAFLLYKEREITYPNDDRSGIRNPAESHAAVLACFAPATERLRALASRRKYQLGIPHPAAVWSDQNASRHAERMAFLCPQHGMPCLVPACRKGCYHQSSQHRTPWAPAYQADDTPGTFVAADPFPHTPERLLTLHQDVDSRERQAEAERLGWRRPH